MGSDGCLGFKTTLWSGLFFPYCLFVFIEGNVIMEGTEVTGVPAKKILGHTAPSLKVIVGFFCGIIL